MCVSPMKGEIHMYLILILLIFCCAPKQYQEPETKPEPIKKTMVRFSTDKLHWVLQDTTIDIISIDTVIGETDTGYYIDYLEK